jgi:hypothetical protein
LLTFYFEISLQFRNIVPKPIEEKRVLVGRVEILLKSEEGLLSKVMNIILSHYQSMSEVIIYYLSFLF